MSDLWRLSASDLAVRIRSKQVSATEAAKDALARLDAVNPKINAVVDHRPAETLAEAARIDAMIARGEDAGPLAGVPITIKVNADQQGYATTNGLRLQKDLIAQQDNPVVANLRKAGAVIVGRTNTPAFSLRWFTRKCLRYPWAAPNAWAHSGLECFRCRTPCRRADHGGQRAFGANHRRCEACFRRHVCARYS